MDVSAINKVTEVQNNSMQEIQQIERQELNAKESAPSNSVDAFNSVLNNAIATKATAANETKSLANFVSSELLNMVDRVQNDKNKVKKAADNYSNLSPKDLLEVQKNLEDYHLTTQVVSKLVSSAVKQIDTLVRIQ